MLAHVLHAALQRFLLPHDDTEIDRYVYIYIHIYIYICTPSFGDEGLKDLCGKAWRHFFLSSIIEM